jgi:hypothetical protein
MACAAWRPCDGLALCGLKGWESGQMAYHLGSGRLSGRQEGQSERGVRRTEVALQTEHEDVPVVERGVELRLPLQSRVSQHPTQLVVRMDLRSRKGWPGSPCPPG